MYIHVKTTHGKLLFVLIPIFLLDCSKSCFSQVSRLALGHDGPSRPKRCQLELSTDADCN